jgi:hypothetical protein
MGRIVIFAAGLCFFILPGILFSQSSKIHLWVHTNTADGQHAEFFVVLKERADFSLAFQMSRKIDRGTFVYRSLFDIAQISQAPLKDWLQSRGIKFQSFYIINALLIKAGREIVDELAARDDVERIEGNPAIRNVIPEPASEKVSPNALSAIEWNIVKTKAPDLWDIGFTGQGIVIGGADTGYRWTHDSLRSKYRGWNGTTADHDYNWHDSIHSGGGSCGSNATEPCDDNGHGTHTMGTVVGDDGAGNQIGMAPGAKWIGCRNMNQGAGTPASYLECLEFFLAPYPLGGTPAQGDPSLAPDITSNSWSCPPSEGCSATSLQAAVDAQKAAGIMTVAAAQNSGPSCGTVNDPIGTYGSAYAVGSTTNSANNLLSSFSSRGPADSTGLTKPNIVAPGSSIRSASRTSDSAYTVLSGTSMATPNVAGGIALIWSALSGFKNNQNATAALLNRSAVRLPHIVEACGGDYVSGPNNSWGYGLMDVLAAFNAGCLFCDDFENGIPPAGWAFIKPGWDEMGGYLVGTPSGKKAIAIATPTFDGCLNCTIEAHMQTSGGPNNILTLFGWYLDKNNTIELIMKQQTGKWILKQRFGGSVVAKAKGSLPISVGVDYTVSLSYDGTQFELLVNSTPVLTLVPEQPVSSGTAGFQSRNTTGKFGGIEIN